MQVNYKLQLGSCFCSSMHACLCVFVSFFFLDIFSILKQLWLLYELIFHRGGKDDFVSKDMQ